MNVPVFWVSRHPEILARGYADQGFLEAMLARRIWTPADAITFEHHEVRGDFPAVPGAFVVLPARHHAGDTDVAWFLEQIDRLDWSVVLLAGDEAWEFPWQRVTETDRRRVWVMQPIPQQAHLGMIPGGWYPGTDVAMAGEAERAEERPLDWFFAGQVTHPRRERCVKALRRMPQDRAVLHETDGYLRGMPQPEYWRLMAGAKVVPCPSGPCTVDTARPLEALEAAAVPIVDLIRPGDVSQFNYWTLCFGEDCPLPGISDWNQFPELLGEALAEWPANANRLSGWWQGWKRSITRQLDEDLRAVAAQPPDLSNPDDVITVIVPTSPIPSHPSTEVIDQTIASIRAQLPLAEVVIAIDGVRPEQEDRSADYQEYVRRLLRRTNFDWHNVVPVVLPGWGHQANATRAALELVASPLVLFVEHDTPLVGEIEWRKLCEFVASGQANAVRFHHETSILDVHRSIMFDDQPQRVQVGQHVVRARRTKAWWQRPHLASTRFYRERIMPIFGEDSRTMIEDVVYGLMSRDCSDYGEAGWWDWRVWIYTPEGDSIKRSTHLDGRGDDTKYEMWL